MIWWAILTKKSFVCLNNALQKAFSRLTFAKLEQKMKATNTKIQFFKNSGTTCLNLFNFLNDNLNKFEHIVIQHWTENYFYIEVEDERVNTFNSSYRIGFSVDCEKDKIFWNCDGGNCYVRSNRWKKKLKQLNCSLGQPKMHYYADLKFKEKML